MNNSEKIKEIIGRYKSTADFARTFGIPYRTAQDWSRGVTTPPKWAINLLDKAGKL